METAATLELCKCLASQMKIMLSVGACRFFLSRAHGDFIYTRGGGAFIYCNAQTHLVLLHSLNKSARLQPSTNSLTPQPGSRPNAHRASAPLSDTPKCIHSDADDASVCLYIPWVALIFSSGERESAQRWIYHRDTLWAARADMK